VTTYYLESGNIFFQLMLLSHNLVFALARGRILLAVCWTGSYNFVASCDRSASVLYSVGCIRLYSYTTRNVYEVAK